MAVVAGAATWGTTGTSQAVAALDASPSAVGAARTVAGAVALVVLVALTSRASSTPTTRVRVPRGWLLLAGAAIAGYQVLFFAGVAATGVAIGTVVGIGSAPVLTGAVAWLLDGARPAARWWVATALAVVGCALVLAPAGNGAAVDALGVVLALGAGLAYAVLTVASRRLLDAGAPPTTVMAQVFGVGAVPSVLVLLTADDAVALLAPRGLVLVAWLAVVTVALGYALYARGLRVLPPATVGTLTLTEPLVAATLGVLLLAERPGPTAVAGAGLLALGLVLVARAPRGAT